MDRQLLLAKAEVTYGVDPTLAAANSVLCENVSFKVTGQRVSPDPAKPGVGPVASYAYGERVEMSLEIPLAGSGTAGVAPKWAPILKACGWSEAVVADTSVTYALLANPEVAPSLALKWRDGNRRVHQVLGFRGRAGLKLSAGQRPMIVVNGRGLHTPVSTAGAVLAHADANFAGWLDSRPVSNGTSTFSFNEVDDLGIREFSFDPSDNVKFTDVPGQENVSLLGARKFTGKAKVTTPLASVLNFEQLWVDAGVYDFSMTHGSAAGNIVTVNGRTQVVEPTYSREDDYDVCDFGLELVPSSLTTDDDLVIVLT